MTGVKTSLARQVREVAELVPNGAEDERSGVAAVLRTLAVINIADNPMLSIADRLDVASDDCDVVAEIASVVAKKDVSKLTAEDFGIAAGVLKMAKVMGEMNRRIAVVLPSGGRRELPEINNDVAEKRICEDVSKWNSELRLTNDELAALVIRAIYSPTVMPPDSNPTTEDTDTPTLGDLSTSS